MARTPKLPLVQVLRAVAALLVVAQHVQHDAAALVPGFEPSTLLPWNAGVDVFFVISGFIIVHASRSLHGEPGAWRPFLVRRAARVVPLYWFATTLYLAVALAAPGTLGAGGRGLDPGLVAASYLFLPWARPDGYVQPLYSLGWTLNYEVFFYALFAACLALPARRAVAALCAGLAGLAALGAILDLPEPLAFWTRPIILEFGFGAALGLARAEGAQLSGRAAVALAAAGVALLVLAAGDEPPLPRALAYGVPAALLVAATALVENRRQGGFAPALIALGNASYALYLVHPFASRLARVVAGRLGLVDAPWIFVAAATLLSILAALAVRASIERPLERRLRRAADRSASVGPTG